MTSYNNTKKRELIMSHYTTPNNKKDIEKGSVEVFSTRCIDQLKLTATIKDKQIKEINFDGKGCAIFLASTDICIDQIKNKSINEIYSFLKEYHKSINGLEYDEVILGKASIFDNIKKHLNRYECGEIIYTGLTKLISDI